MKFDPSKKKLPKNLSIQDIKAQARALKQRQGWDPTKFVSESPLEKLQQLNQQQANKHVYQETDACSACADLRQAQNDPTALCDTHLAEAMGF